MNSVRPLLALVGAGEADPFTACPATQAGVSDGQPLRFSHLVPLIGLGLAQTQVSDQSPGGSK